MPKKSLSKVLTINSDIGYIKNIRKGARAPTANHYRVPPMNVIATATATEIANNLRITCYSDVQEFLTTLEFNALFAISEEEIAPAIQAVLNALADRLNRENEFDAIELSEWATEGVAAVNRDLAEYGFVITVPTFTATGETSDEVNEREWQEELETRRDLEADYWASR